MAQSKITLIGIENYLNPERSIFEDLTLPEGIDKDVLIGAIALRCQEFELLYSDPDFLIAAVNVWGQKNYWTFDRWVKLLNKNYDPLYNKDYHEVFTDTHTGNYSASGTTANTGSANTSGTGSETTTHREKAYNDASYVDTSQDEAHSSSTGTQQIANNTTNNESGTNGYTTNHSYHGYGNIGITSAQELFLREARDVATFNMYEHMADLFCSEFCIMVY